MTRQTEVLGYALGLDPGTRPKDETRSAEEKAMAVQIAMLPCHQDFKQRVATALLAGSAAWGKNCVKVTWVLLITATSKKIRLAVFGNNGTLEERLQDAPMTGLLLFSNNCSFWDTVQICGF